MINKVNFNSREEIVNSKMFTIENKKRVLNTYDTYKSCIEHLLPIAESAITLSNNLVEEEMSTKINFGLNKKYKKEFKLVKRKEAINTLDRILTDRSLGLSHDYITVKRRKVRLYASQILGNDLYAYVPLKGAKKNKHGWLDSSRIYFLDLQRMIEKQVEVCIIQEHKKRMEILPYRKSKTSGWGEEVVFRVVDNQMHDNNWRKAFRVTYARNSYSSESRDYTNLATIIKKYGSLCDTHLAYIKRAKEIAKQEQEAKERLESMQVNVNVTEKFLAEQMFVKESELKIDWNIHVGTGKFTLGKCDFECKLKMLCNETDYSDIITKISVTQPSNPFQLFNKLTGGLH